VAGERGGKQREHESLGKGVVSETDLYKLKGNRKKKKLACMPQNRKARGG